MVLFKAGIFLSLLVCSNAFVASTPKTSRTTTILLPSSSIRRQPSQTTFTYYHGQKRIHSRSRTQINVSEVHIPGYRESKLPFILTEEDIYEETSRSTSSSGGGGGGGGMSTTMMTPATATATVATTATTLLENTYTSNDYTSLIPHQNGHLLHKTTNQIFTTLECQSIITEAEYIAHQMGWTTNRHGNYPTTDIPIVELPNTMKFLRKALVQRIYPLLRTQFGECLPNGGLSLRVADGFIVKYDAEGGQAELKPHRDGSVLSFNIALNPATDFVGGGTWFDSLKDAVKIDEGEMVSHASGILHGGHAISSGKRYILVAFVIVEGYDSWSMRFYNQVRNL